MAVNEGQDDLIRALLAFCNNEGSLWRALKGSAGVQLITFLLGLSPERQQECAVALLCLLSNESDESKWDITVAGGIPPLVQVLETGSTKAKEDSAKILTNLCNHSETIRACVESSNAVPGLLSLLKNGSPNGKEIAAKTLNHLTHKSDTTTINQLTALLTSDLPESKVYVLDAWRSMLSVAPLSDIQQEGSATSDAMDTMINPIVLSIADSTPTFQDKTIEILSQLCRDQPVVLGNNIVVASGCLCSLAKRVIGTKHLKVKIGGAALLICAAKVNHQRLVEDLNQSNLCVDLIHSLVNMLSSALLLSKQGEENKEFISILINGKEDANGGESNTSTAIVSNANLAVWLLSILASHDEKCKIAIVEAGAIDVLTLKISECYSQYTQVDYKEDSSMWICALLLAVLFQDRDIIRTHASMKSVAVVANLLKSEELANRYFAAQSVASLVCNGSRGTLLSVAKSGAASGLISLLGCADIYIQGFLGLSEEFSLVRYPDQVALERLFRLDDIRVGATSRKAIPALIDLLKPIPDRPGAPFLALGLLTQLARDCPSNKIVMVEYGALEALTEYLSLSPQDANEEAATDVLGILFDNAQIRRNEAAFGAVTPLVAVLRLGGRGARYSAARALENLFGNTQIRSSVAPSRCVAGLSKVILHADPSLHHALWETAASILSSILQFSSEFYLEVPIAVLVRLLRAGSESIVIGALNALLVLGSDDETIAEAMAESGTIEALLELLRSHQCEETAARLLKVLLNNVKIRQTKATRSAIVPISHYLLNPQTQGQQARFLATLALGNLFQNESLARTRDAISACHALVNVLKDQPTEEMKVVAICALKNLVMYSPSNQRAVAEHGGVQVVLDLIDSSDPETSVQAAMFIKLLFYNNKIQEYASSQAVRAMTAAIEKDLWATGNVHDEYLRALNALFSNCPQLMATESVTLSIPHLVTSLNTGSEATQEAALDTLFLLRQAWSTCQAEVSRAQLIAAADAIPSLQYLIQSGPPGFQEKAEFLLQCLPGTLVVIIKRGNNMKQSVGNPRVCCNLTLENTPPRQTTVVSTGPNPEWDESFSWSFESPPIGWKLHISCKNKSIFGKSSFGKVTIQIDSVVMLGSMAGEYTLLPQSKSGRSRNLEVEFQWSNK